jgi:hypothetical protein
MMIVVLAKIFQMIKCATTKHLSQQQKQPIDILFLLSNYRFQAIFLAAMHTSRQFWMRPNFRCPISHVVHVCDQILRDHIKFCHQIERYLEFSLTTLALNVARDVKDSVL